MTKLLRQGECNRCGQCCGSDGVPPWHAGLVEDMANWGNIEDIENAWPLMKLANFVQQNDRWLILNEGKQINIGGVGKITFELHPTNGFTKPGTTACPLLGDDPGDGTRSCMLAGTRFDAVFTDFCKEYPRGQGSPRFVYEDSDLGTAQEQLDFWMEQFPDCSFTYVEEVE